MKLNTFKVALATFLLAASLVAPFTVDAFQVTDLETPNQTAVDLAHYVVQSGDKLTKAIGSTMSNWDSWYDFSVLNPDKVGKGRFQVKRGGKLINISFDDFLKIADDRGVWVRYNWKPGETFNLSGTDLVPEDNTATKPAPKPTSATNNVSGDTDMFNMPKWAVPLGLLLLGILAVLIAYVYNERRKREHIEADGGVYGTGDLWGGPPYEAPTPETAGPPVVPGGLTWDTAPSHLREQVAEYHFLEPDEIKVERIRGGLANGKGTIVGYGDGSEQEHELFNRPCFEITYRTPGMNADTPSRVAYSLWGCGNPVRAGRPDLVAGEGFTFTPYEEGANVPFPQAWTVPVEYIDVDEDKAEARADENATNADAPKITEITIHGMTIIDPVRGQAITIMLIEMPDDEGE